MGGGVYVRDAYLLCTNNTLADNYAEYKGGGFRGSACTGLIRNSIFWNNDAPDYPQLHSATSDILVEYCDVEGGCTGEGNIDVEPVFTNPSCNDYSLTWRSACINMGTNQDAPETDREGDSRPFMGTVDMGAYEFRGTHSLQAWTLSLEASTGGQIELMLNGGEFNAFRQYLIMGSMSGKVPGNPLPDGGGFFFLNLDLFSSIVWQLTNTIHFQDFLGNLDAFGKATALIDLPPIPDFAGETMHLAFVLLGPPWDFASNPLDIEVID
jgi:hypothetical protein